MNMTRKGFTLVELLVVVAIIAIIGSLLFGFVGGCSMNSDPVTGKSYYDASLEKTDNYRCVKTYEYTSGGSDDSSATTSKRIDAVKVDENGNDVGNVLTFTCDDDWWADIGNSGTIYAQFQTDKFYRVTTMGFRNESMHFARFPNVKSVSAIPRPSTGETQAEAEFPE